MYDNGAYTGQEHPKKRNFNKNLSGCMITVRTRAKNIRKKTTKKLLYDFERMYDNGAHTGQEHPI